MNFLRKLLGQRLINFYHLLQAILANFIYGFPSRRLKVIGVTGTDGKTTTTNMIAAILKEAGFKTSFLSTINAEIGEEKFDTGLHTTTPSPYSLQKLLRKMADAGSEYAVIEVTSHALDQYRTWGIEFETGIITNISHEHLDYHKTKEKYARAKARLFAKTKYSVLNMEDGSYQTLSKLRHKKVISYGLTNQADIWADDISESLKETRFQAHTEAGDFEMKLNLPGQFNVANALATIAACNIYNIDAGKIKAALSKFKGITGRLEFFDEGQEFYAMVDFAHTPNALEKLLSFLRPKISGKLIVVFGAAGERDRAKRPLMGEAAEKYADLIIITREDNRSEDVIDIARQIASGIDSKRESEGYYIIPDRRDAIRFALGKAQKGDLVVATGKGHEMSLNVDGQETTWNDREVMREELRTLRITN